MSSPGRCRWFCRSSCCRHQPTPRSAAHVAFFLPPPIPLPQELAREAAMKAGGGNSGSEDWLLETLDAADAAALGDTVSAAVAGSSREAAAAAAGGDGIAAPGRSGSSSRGSMGGANGSSSSSGGSEGRSSGNGSGSGSNPGAESQEVEVCVPLLVGNPGQCCSMQASGPTVEARDLSVQAHCNATLPGHRHAFFFSRFPSALSSPLPASSSAAWSAVQTREARAQTACHANSCLPQVCQVCHRMPLRPADSDSLHADSVPQTARIPWWFADCCRSYPADSDSLDADSVPCVPAELASRLTTPAAVKAFVAQYQKNKRVRCICALQGCCIAQHTSQGGCGTVPEELAGPGVWNWLTDRALRAARLHQCSAACSK